MQIPLDETDSSSSSLASGAGAGAGTYTTTANENSITLSFNGVNFCLTPAAPSRDTYGNGSSNTYTGMSNGITITPNKDGAFTTIQMDSFTGCLSVSLSSTNNINNSNNNNFVKMGATTATDGALVVSPGGPATPPPMSLATVEDEGSTSAEDDDDARAQKEVKSKKNKNKKKAEVFSSLKGQQQLSFEKKKRVLSDISTDPIDAPTKGVSSSKSQAKKVEHNAKKRRNESVASKSPRNATAATGAPKSEPKDVVKREDVSSLLGQSMTLSQESSSSVYNVNDVLFETTDSEKRDADASMLKRKISIQQLVDCDDDLTQTQRDDCYDDTSSMSQGGHNTIVEIDETEETQVVSNVSSSSSKTVEKPVAGVSNDSIDLPSPRWGSTMNMIDQNRILVYGGQGLDSKTNEYTTLNDLYVYDLAKKTWKQPINCVGMPRTWHSSTYLPDLKLLISFGGEKFNPKTKKIQTTDQVMVLDTDIMLWYPPSVSGQIPSGRSGHTASLLPGTKEVVVFGGVKNSKWQNSVAVLDTTRWHWTVPKIIGDAPRPRSYHSATAVPSLDNRGCILVVFGGNNGSESMNTVHVLDTSGEDGSWTWSHPKITGTPPSPRTGHCATLLQDNKTILIYGGWDPMEDEDESEGGDETMICGDSFLLNTETWTWTPGPKSESVSHSGSKNFGPKRTGAQSLLVQGNEDSCSRVLVFGGRLPQEKFANDFLNLTVSQQMIDAEPKYKL